MAAAAERWFVYLVECGDGSLYCGVAKDVDARVFVHNEGKGAKYTRARLPVRLVATSRAMGKQDAYRLEHRVKRAKRDRKLTALTSG
jgi:putative endonuclease